MAFLLVFTTFATTIFESMKILVCISKVPDTTAKIAFSTPNTYDENGVTFIINPYDEWYALVRALELKETLGGTVTVVSVGGADYEPIIRKALAIGADDGVRIDAPESDAFAVAREIAEYAKSQSYDILLCGKETIQYNGGVVPGMIAEMLQLPYVFGASKLDVSGTSVVLEREIATGIEVFHATLPIVISAAKGLAEQRIPNMRGIMAARTKPLNVIASCNAQAKTHVAKFDMPPAKSGCKMIAPEDAAQLIQLLHEEAKVI
jgi:electron transfer flavoprotein beta subunit